MIEEIMKLFIDEFSFYGKKFDDSLGNLDRVSQWCEEKHLILNREKCHFMVLEGVVLGQIKFEHGIEVDKPKIKAHEG